ncbi:MAG: LPXTG cell wall anchor domain-containing protein [Yaniella sp.]|nr:LPXTG cell wall anchor domain-containing protein [Yaniella sp.]MDN6520495.1 LPXTG cell wall anchor domain-containing protein [Yaniella sp.]
MVEETPPPTETPSPGEETTPGPTDPADPKGPAGDTPGDKEGELPSTGANFALFFGALGLLLLVIGGLLYARHRSGSEV